MILLQQSIQSARPPRDPIKLQSSCFDAPVSPPSPPDATSSIQALYTSPFVLFRLLCFDCIPIHLVLSRFFPIRLVHSRFILFRLLCFDFVPIHLVLSRFVPIRLVRSRFVSFRVVYYRVVAFRAVFYRVFPFASFSLVSSPFASSPPASFSLDKFLSNSSPSAPSSSFVSPSQSSFISSDP